MRLASATSAASKDDSDYPAMTPRGMAAPPPPRPSPRLDSDPSRPATIRIEATARGVPPRRRDLERELDRVQKESAPATAQPGRPANWLLWSQGLLLNAFVILLVFGWNSPLPGRRMLLCGLALAGALVAGLLGFALSGARDSKVAGFPLLAGRALPAVFVTGWIALSLYALALPPSAKAYDEARTAPITPAVVATPARSPVRNVSTQAQTQTPQSVEPGAAKDSAPPQAAKRSPFKW